MVSLCDSYCALCGEPNQELVHYGLSREGEMRTKNKKPCKH